MLAFHSNVNYYRRFIPRLVSTLLSLYQLANLSKLQEFYWQPEHDSSFREAKTLLAEASTLALPFSQAPTQVIADASENAVAAVSYSNWRGIGGFLSLFIQRNCQTSSSSGALATKNSSLW
ncbi:hypothetical protein M514_08151 [Trichuris suis]|uniref:Reverse transcriptase/retrotransposon-derived protein RNase H-like domain-containing protein n=1 Tax=Trichuris suis TaxID=68888 RepID=A0A085M173_9BILA|nr:hypothetical protein M513_08151 [Trichuris suis]KFD71898.1 hypothetical protein M514_08151 [Trichuris suis]